MAHEAPVIACLLFALAAPAAADKQYTLADLEQLVGERAYEEAVSHLGDVAPAQRTPKWVEVASAASTGLLATLPDEGKLGAIDAIDRMYPQLLKHASYAKARATHGVVGLTSCYRGWRASECSQLGLRLATNGDRALVIEVAKAAATRDASLSVALWKRVLDKQTCRDGDLKSAAIAEISRTSPAPDARAIVQTCWEDVKGKLVEAFDQAGKGSVLYKNTCDLLEAKGALSSLQLKRCRAK